MDPKALALEVALELPARDSRQVGRELHRQLRAAIVSGRLQPGLRLPSSRDMAASLGLSRNTVVAAYDLLLSEGYVGAHGRGGTVVSDLLGAPARDRGERAGAHRDRRLGAFWRRPLTPIPISERERPRFDMTVGTPDWRAFPFDVWRRLTVRAIRGVARTRAGYGEPGGRAALRAAIAGHVSFACAIACTPEDIVVTAGAQQAFDLLARILVTPGETIVAVEEPGYRPLRGAFAAAGAKLAPVPVDGDGIRVDRLPPATNVVCVTPSHQFPLGMHLSLARRAALLEFARTRRAVVIEDDYDGEFRFARHPLDALKTLDRAQSVFYVGTFSKSLFPALRLGFVIVPPWARAALTAAKQLTDWNAPLVDQDALAAFIAEGHLARHVRKMRAIYGERRGILEHALARHCGRTLEVVGIGAGMHLAAWVDPAIAVPALIDRAQAAGIGLDAMQKFATARGGRGGLVFGYGAIDSSRIDDAVGRLARLM